MNDQHFVDATLQWVDDIVIKHNFCPFARFVRTPNQIHCEVVWGDGGDAISALYQECKRLDESNSVATTLVILPSAEFNEFDHYLDILAIGERMLSDWGYSGVYQLASFHPKYQFEDELATSSANYTNRAPYPLLHLIRESDIERYIKSEDDAEKIYLHNIKKADELGCPYFASALATMQKEKQ